MTKKVTMAAATAGRAEGGTPLNAFDNALLAAGIGNINLIKVSSILPPGVELIALPQDQAGRARADRLRGHDQRGARRDRRGRRRLGACPRIRPRTASSWSSTTRPPGTRPSGDRRDARGGLPGARRDHPRHGASSRSSTRSSSAGCALAAITLLADEDLV